MGHYTIEYKMRGKLASPADWRKLRYDGNRLHYRWGEVESYNLTSFTGFLVCLLTILLHPDMRLVRVKLW